MTWRERVMAARERGRFTGEDVRLAESWRTCAVGEQIAAYPEVIQVEKSTQKIAICRPLDDILFGLGGDGFDGFLHAVVAQDFDLAENLLDRIEDRVLELKRETHNA